VVTFAGWSTEELWDAGYLMVWLDTRNSVAAEYYLLLRSDGRAMLGSLWRVQSTGPDSFLGSAPVHRLSGRSVSVSLRLRRLTFGPKRDFFRWWVVTLFNACPRTCVDRAPNGTATRQQWLPGRSPTPSPSPSPSPTPSPTP
jgi:hypothetical protein